MRKRRRDGARLEERASGAHKIRPGLRATVAQLVEDPGDLDKAGRQRAGPRARRPGAVALAGARRAEAQRLLGHRDEQRALEAEGDVLAGGEILRDGVDQVDDLRSAAVALDLGRGGSLRAQPKRPLGTSALD